MYNYHSKLEADHPFSSSWYTWPISYKPVWYHLVDYEDNTRETISGIGNILIWWIGMFAMIYLIPRMIKNKDKGGIYFPDDINEHKEIIHFSLMTK